MHRRIASIITLVGLAASGLATTGTAAAATTGTQACTPSITLLSTTRTLKIITHEIAYETCGETLRLNMRFRQLPDDLPVGGSMGWGRVKGAGTVTAELWGCTSNPAYTRRDVATLKRIGSTVNVVMETWLDEMRSRPWCPAL
jgi:hypothetical protein